MLMSQKCTSSRPHEGIEHKIDIKMTVAEYKGTFANPKKRCFQGKCKLANNARKTIILVKITNRYTYYKQRCVFLK